MKMLKKSVAILLAAMLLIGSMSVLSFAAFDDGEETTVSFDTLFFRQENGEWVQTTKAEPGEVIRVRFVIKTDYKVGFAQTLYAFDKGFFESTAANKQISEFVSGDDWEAPMNANNPIVSALGIGGNYSPDHPVSYLMDGWPVEIPQADQQNLQFVSFKMFRPNVSADARVYDSDEWMYEIELTVREDVQPGATATVAAYQPHYQTEDNYDAFASVGRMVDNGNGSYSNVAAGDWTYYEVTDSDVQYVWNDTDANSTLSIDSTVTFNGNGGTIAGAATATATGIVGTAIGNQAPAADPVQEGKNFLGWSTDPEATGDDDLLDTADLANETFPYTDDVVYYAIYEDSDASITLNVYVQNADGTWPATPTTTNPGAATGAVVTVSAAGVTSVDGGETTTYYTAPEHFSIDTTQSDASVTVVAGAANPVNVYVARAQYTVTFDGTGSPAYYESSATAPAAAAREGYEFDKWVNSADSTDTLAEEASYTVTGDKAYTSVYLPISTEDNLTVVHQIYNDLANGGAPVDNTTSFNFVSDRNVMVVETAPSEGEGAANTDYITFAELFDIMAATDDHYEYDPDNSGNVLSGTVDPEDGLDLYLYYMPKEYTVTFQYAANDVASTVTDQYYTTINNIPNGRNVDGYNFLGWKLGDTLVTTSDTITITGDATYTAEYEAIERTVHYEYVDAPDGVTQLADDTGIIGDTFDVPDYSSWEDRYTVTILVEDDEGELFDYVIGTSDITVTITFEANPFIIYYYDDDIAASPAYVADVEVLYSADLPTDAMLTTLNGTAFKKEGKHFDGWEYYANGVQLDSLPATMPNNNISAYAVWTDIAYVVTVEGLDGEELEDYGASYGYGEVVDLPTDAEMAIPGYTFDGWEYDPSDVLNADNRVVKDYDDALEVPVTISAVYTPIDLTVRFDAAGGTVNDQPYVDVSGLTVDQDIPTASIPAAPVRTGYHLDEDLTTPEEIWNVQGILDHDEIFNGTPEGIAMVYSPDWIPNEVTVNFDPQGGTFVAPLPEGAVEGDGVVSITGDADDAMTAPTVARAGHAFSHWSDTPNGAAYNVSKIPAIDDASITLYAVWDVTDVTITYVYENAPDGTVAPAAKTDAHIGETVADFLPAIPSVTGYQHTDWVLTGDDNGLVGTSPITATVTWSPIDYTITYVYTGDVAEGAAAPAAVEGKHIGDDFPADPALPVVAGYTITGWTYDPAIVDGKMPASNVTATATWDAIEYTITYVYEGDVVEGTAAPAAVENLNVGDDVPADPALPEVAGYTITGWTYDPAIVDGKMPAANVTATATWDAIEYTVTYAYAGDVADGYTAPAAAADLNVGDAVPADPALPEVAGYTITGWTYDPAIVDGKMPAANVTATATWTKNPYHLTYSISGVAPASFVAPTDNTDYYIGDTATLATVAPVEGYTFSGWKLNGTAVSDVTFEDADIEVTGVWTINSWTADFLDTDGTRLATDTFNYGATITNKPADPDTFGYEFGGWVDTTTYGTPTTFTAGMTMPDHDVAFQLVMTPIDYLVTFVKDGETVYSEELPYDSEIPEPNVDTEKTGYDFIGWFDADDNEYLPGTTVPGEVTYTAVYEGLPVNYSIVKNFQDADWDTPAGSDYVAAPATTATATAGSTVNVDFDAYDVEDGFTLDRAASDATAEIAGDGTTVVNLYYTRNTVTGTIDGAEDEYYFGQTIASAEVQNPDPGLNYTGWVDADTEQAVSFPYTVPNRDFVLDPVSEPNVFTLTFVDEDGETAIGEPQQVAYGAQLAEYTPANPEKDGYEFSGWSDVDTGEQLPETMPAKNATYKAVYRADSNMNYAIKIYVMNVSGTYTSTETVAYGMTGSPVTIQPGQMEGYAVNYDLSHLSDFIAGDGSTVLEIYYDRAGYEVTFYDTDGESVFDGPTEIFFGATIPTPETNPVKEGYNFVKWVDAEENDMPTSMPAEDMDFYPVFEKAEYTITFIVNGAQTIVTYEFDDEVAVPENPVIDGMTFQGWTPEIPERMPAENLIIVAEFDKAAYTVNFVDYDGTPILTSLVDVGTPIGTPSTNPTREYYNFTGWDGYTAGMTMPAQDVTFTATYERVPVKLIPAEGSTTVIERLVDGEVVTESYNDNSVTTDGYAAADFTGWYVYGLDEMINEQDLLNDYLAVQGDGSISIEPFEGRRGFYGTGATVTVTDNVTNEVVETFTIIVFGDLNGDAYITSDDSMMMRSELSGDTFWSDDLDEEYNAARTRAADLNGDGFVATNDRAILYNATLGTILLDQTTGLVAAD